MLRVFVLCLTAFLTVNCLQAQLNPLKEYKTNNMPFEKMATPDDEKSQEELIEAEINGSNLFKPVNPKESLLSIAQKFFSTNSLQSKYASLLNVLPGVLTNIRLLEAIDEWYGTRYKFGGTSKSGIDCSAFVRAVYKAAFDIDLPRTAREQFNVAGKIISTAYLQSGDLLFFNTRGGVSHVGMYLGNNKFVHASSSHGVTVSDLDENYYAARFLGARRMEESNYYAVN